jgi:hypothetical protein
MGSRMSMLVIPALKRLRQEDCNFKARLGYIGRPCLKNKKKDGTGWSVGCVQCIQMAKPYCGSVFEPIQH